MELISHFTMEESEFLILNLKSDEIDTFIDKLPPMFRKCYVSNKKLKESKEELEMEYSDIMRSYIPDPGNVMSGEFGEILSYYLLQEKYLPIELLGPKKWLWKDDRNKPVQKTDVIFFNRNDDVPTKDDLLIAAEIKAKATKNNSYDPIKNAVDGAYDDYVRRVGITLSWLKDKYIKEVNKNAVKYLERFRDPIKFGEYRAHYKAIAIIDEQFFESELKRERKLTDIEGEFEIILISIKGLKDVYEETYMKIFDLDSNAI
jgi:hypothetical protein